MPTDHGKEHDTSAPQIGFGPDILQALDQLRGRIAGGTTSRGQLLARFIHITQSEVDHLEIQLLVKEQVLWLDIPVHYAQLA